jgi:hypothetical protein
MSGPDLAPLAEEERADLLALLPELTVSSGTPSQGARW